MAEVYRKLKQRLEEFPIPVVDGKGILEFLQIVFNEQEAEMLSKFESFTNALTIEDFAHKNGYEISVVRKVFSNLARRNLIHYERKGGRIYFGIQPLVVGIFEAFFLTWREQNPDTLAPAAKAFEDYFNAGFYKVASGSKSPWARIIPSMNSLDPIITRNPELYYKGKIDITFREKLRRIGAIVTWAGRIMLRKIFAGQVAEVFSILKSDGLSVIKRLMASSGVKGKQIQTSQEEENIPKAIKQKIIRINENIPATVNIHPYEVIRHYIEEATTLSISPCACRKAARLLDENYEEIRKVNCKFPIENTCLRLRYGPQLADKYMLKGERLISKAEAIEILNQCEKAGLVHCSYNCREKIDFICNCCPCCCKILGTMIKYHQKYRAFVESNFQPIHQKTECIKCGNCTEICPVHAISRDKEGFPIIDLETCIGCGSCVTNCPKKALILQKVKNQRPAIDTIEAYLNFANQKIKR